MMENPSSCCDGVCELKQQLSQAHTGALTCAFAPLRAGVLRTLSNFLTAKRRVRTAALCAGFARISSASPAGRTWERPARVDASEPWIREGGNEHLTFGGDSSWAPMRSCGDAPSGVLQSASHRDPVPPSLPRVHTPKQRPKRPQSSREPRGGAPCLRESVSGLLAACSLPASLSLPRTSVKQHVHESCSFRSGLSK